MLRKEERFKKTEPFISIKFNFTISTILYDPNHINKNLLHYGLILEQNLLYLGV